MAIELLEIVAVQYHDIGSGGRMPPIQRLCVQFGWPWTNSFVAEFVIRSMVPSKVDLWLDPDPPVPNNVREPMATPISKQEIPPAAKGRAKPDRLPPIRILDIMVLTTAMGVVFFFQEKLQLMLNAMGMSGETSTPLQSMFQLAEAIPMGVSIAGVFWLINQRRITGKFFQQPGHWILGLNILLLAGMTAFYVFFLSRLSGGFAQTLEGDGGIWNIFAGVIVLEFLAAAFLVVATFRTRGVWRWFVGLLIASHLFGAVAYFVFGLFFKSYVTGTATWITTVQENIWILSLAYTSVCVLTLVLAIMLDRRNRVSRDWLHWVALMAFTFQLAVMPILSYLIG